MWEFAGDLIRSKDAGQYWRGLEDVILELTGKSYKELRAYKQLEVERTREIGKEGIEYWESVIASYQSLSQKKAVRRLITAEKIEAKIKTIQAAISREIST